jgi:uncharacterized protein (TIGR03118 family)
MKREINTKLIIVSILAATCFYACKKDMSSTSPNVKLPHNFGNENSFTPFDQINVVDDNPSFGALVNDPELINPWGIAAPPNGPVWVADNGTHGITVYDRRTGATLFPRVSDVGDSGGGTNHDGDPTGAVFNPNPLEFGGNHFIFVSEDGTITGWSSGSATTILIDNSATGAVYKGCAIANDGIADYLYVTNFHAGTIEVYDVNLNPVPSRPAVVDPAIPAGYAPFGIQNIGGDLYVTYAKQKGPLKHDDQAGMGNGYVDVYNHAGSFLRRFASRGDLNSPWGIALAPAGFATNVENVLVGNFGSGRIDIFDDFGVYMGQLLSMSKHLQIDGLWSIDFLKGNRHGVGAGTDSLYFTAGPNGENDGIFGFLKQH